MISGPKRIKMIDHQAGIFRFLDTIDIAVPRNVLMWHGEDIDAPGVIAAIMRGYAERGGMEVAYIIVGDVTDDPTEPVISAMTDEETQEISILLIGGTQQFCRENDISFVKWTGSSLNFRDGVYIMVSGYVVEMEGIGHQQRITARFFRNSRKWFIETAFTVSLSEKLARPMFFALHPVSFVNSGVTKPI